MKPQSVNMNIDTGEKTWLTPPHIINALGTFDLDPCCPPQMPWKTATRMVCRPDDGLAVDWSGQRVWLNPPYGREAVPFLRKMAKNTMGGGYASHIRAHGHFGVAGLDISVRKRSSVSARTVALLSRRRHKGRDIYRSVCARRVFASRPSGASRLWA